MSIPDDCHDDIDSHSTQAVTKMPSSSANVRLHLERMKMPLIMESRHRKLNALTLGHLKMKD